MQTFEEYLLAQGFSKVDTIELLKITLNEQEDLRYFFENNKLGLHITKQGFYAEEFWGIMDMIDTKQLEVLYISRSYLKELTVDDKRFPNIKFINFNQNNALNKLYFKNLTKLEELNAHHCPELQVVHIKDNFPSLQKIDISYCIIEEIVLPKQLPALWYLNFTQNRITDTLFLKFIQKNTQLTIDYLFWGENQLPESLINTLERGDIEVLKVYFGKDGEKLVSIFRKKLILLGNTQAGKTSLCDILLDSDKADGSSTHGINIFTYQPEKDKVIQVFDFGGQDFYHNAHLSFYSINANYLLVYGNGQKDEYGNIPAKGVTRADDIFPKHYWLNSLNTNLRISAQDKTQDIHNLFQQKNIKLALLENVKENEKAQRLNQKNLEEEFVATEFWHFPLRKIDGTKLIKSYHIKSIIDNWILEDIRQDKLRQDIKDWGENIQISNLGNAIVDKSSLLKKDGTPISEEELKLLHDSYYIFLCEAKNEQVIPKILEEKVIVDLALFSQWIYAILNLENLLGKGYFNKENAKDWLVTKEYNNALAHLDFIIAFLLHEKMIFQIEKSESYLVPQYLSEPQKPADKLLLKLFKTPFVKYQFTGFYHTQLLTNIIAKFFEYVAKEQVDKQYRHLIWKNRVILYLEKQTEVENSNPINFLLIEFAIVNQEPTLSLSVLDNNDLSQRYESIKKVVDFIDKSLQDTYMKYHKLIKAPNNHYINAELLKDNNTDGKGNITDLIFDNKAKCFYRKGDFPLFVDPKKIPMKKIFISYSKFDEPFKNEFKSHLISLQRENLVNTFDDRELELGEKWDSTLHKKIQECDYFVCLVSVKFLNVGYIESIELPEAFRNNKRLILIIIKPCDWQNFPITWLDSEGNRKTEKLGNYNAFDKGRFIGLQENYIDSQKTMQLNTEIERDYQWLSVIQEIRKLINKDLVETN